MIDGELFQRLERRVEYDTNGGCWLWTGTMFPSGYGCLTVRRYKPFPLRSHRAMWTALHGDPGDLLVLHSCDTPACVNPAHLRLGTPKDNADDMWKRGRGRPSRFPGSRNYRALLDEAQVALIRARLGSGEREADLAREYGVAPCTINNIRHFRRWTHVARND